MKTRRVTNGASCCDEYERVAGLSRRRFLGGMAAGAGLGVATSVFGDVFRQAAFAQTTGGNVLVVISLRGGVDGLSVVVPHAEPNYYQLRPGIGVAKGSLLCADATFGLHPQLKPLEQFWNNATFAAVHAVGLAVPDRSHFTAMETVEDADPGSLVRTGWVNRAIGLDSGAFPTQAVQFGTTIVPASMSGPAPVLATGALKDLYLAGASPADDPTWRSRRRAQLATIWDNAHGALGAAARAAFATVEQMEPYTGEEYTPHGGAVYPKAWPAGDLSLALKNTAQLIRADVGTEVVALDYGSWDMHTDLGTLQAGEMQSMLGGFASALAAFLTDVGDLGDRVTVVTISEFGRRLEENSGFGVDHGWGNVMLLAGGGVKGGQYYGSWPGLSDADLNEGDLAVTTDYRNVLAEIVRSRFNRTEASIFPSLSYQPLNVMSPYAQ